MNKTDQLLASIAPDSAYAKGFRDALESVVLALRAEHVTEASITNSLMTAVDAYSNNVDLVDPDNDGTSNQVPQAYKVMGGRMYEDRVFLKLPSAEDSLRNRNDGAHIRPLVFARDG